MGHTHRVDAAEPVLADGDAHLQQLESKLNNMILCACVKADVRRDKQRSEDRYSEGASPVRQMVFWMGGSYIGGLQCIAAPRTTISLDRINRSEVKETFRSHFE